MADLQMHLSLSGQNCSIKKFSQVRQQRQISIQSGASKKLWILRQAIDKKRTMPRIPTYDASRSKHKGVQLKERRKEKSRIQRVIKLLNTPLKEKAYDQSKTNHISSPILISFMREQDRGPKLQQSLKKIKQKDKNIPSCFKLYDNLLKVRRNYPYLPENKGYFSLKNNRIYYGNTKKQLTIENSQKKTILPKMSLIDETDEKNVFSQACKSIRDKKDKRKQNSSSDEKKLKRNKLFHEISKQVILKKSRPLWNDKYPQTQISRWQTVQPDLQRQRILQESTLFIQAWK